MQYLAHPFGSYLLTLLTTTLFLNCNTVCDHTLISYTYTLCSLKYSCAVCYSAENCRLILHSDSRLDCISPCYCAIRAFALLLPPLKVGCCEVSWRELCSHVLDYHVGCSQGKTRLCGSAAFGIGTRWLNLGWSLLALFIVVWPSVIGILYSRLLPARCLD